jgi:hypothetical protein
LKLKIPKTKNIKKKLKRKQQEIMLARVREFRALALFIYIYIYIYIGNTNIGVVFMKTDKEYSVANKKLGRRSNDQFCMLLWMVAA